VGRKGETVPLPEKSDVDRRRRSRPLRCVVSVPAKVGRLLEAMERDPLRSQVPGEARGAGPSADQSPSSGLTAKSTPDRLQANFSA